MRIAEVALRERRLTRNHAPIRLREAERLQVERLERGNAPNSEIDFKKIEKFKTRHKRELKMPKNDQKCEII